MLPFVEIDHVDQVFPLPGGGEYIALKNIDLTIRKGEFVSLLGHSGCGKSTLLNIIAGLAKPAAGALILEGRQVTEPGPDRMVVFQNYSLLPWLTVRENIALAVNRVMATASKSEREAIVEQHIDLVNLRHAADKRPGQLSGGMKQRVAIARALSIRPKLLLLDEPFGALDALTRSSLQDQLMQIAEEHELTCIMVTHDVDEALLLSDRIVMLTNGPESYIGQIMDVPFERPRDRLEVVNDPSYYGMRSEIVYFLNQQKQAKKRKAALQVGAIARNGLEKVNLELGFVPLTDCAPLVVAKELGFFEKYGLEQVTLSREPSWKAIAEDITSGRLDAAQMIAGMPLALTLGMGGKALYPSPQASSSAATATRLRSSKRFLHDGVRTVEDLKAAIARTPDKVPTMAVVHPASMHNLMTRHWLASGGIDPDRDVNIVTIPPPQMVAALKGGGIDGFCVGEPWNSRAIQEGLGYAIAPCAQPVRHDDQRRGCGHFRQIQVNRERAIFLRRASANALGIHQPQRLLLEGDGTGWRGSMGGRVCSRSDSVWANRLRRIDHPICHRGRSLQQPAQPPLKSDRLPDIQLHIHWQMSQKAQHAEAVWVGRRQNARTPQAAGTVSPRSRPQQPAHLF
uniref:ATP binding protein n=1 Tax=Leptolyngbya laminosa TaxID=477181 RepID=Q51882_LEPLM|nr:ATP binding protein [Thermoleptolyngbya oregonensis PCC 8501]